MGMGEGLLQMQRSGEASGLLFTRLLCFSVFQVLTGIDCRHAAERAEAAAGAEVLGLAVRT
jgi:hypothetical protein